jgi:hypothetical protein
MPVVVEIPGTETYSKMMGKTDITTSQSNGWELSVSESDEGFQHLSFVNSVRTFDEKSAELLYVSEILIKHIRQYIFNKTKVDFTPSEIKRKMCIVLSAKVTNPMFSTDLKTKLISIQEKPKLQDSFIKRVCILIGDSFVNLASEKTEKRKQSNKVKLMKRIHSIDVTKLSDFVDSVEPKRLIIVPTEYEYCAALSCRNPVNDSVWLSQLTGNDKLLFDRLITNDFEYVVLVDQSITSHEHQTNITNIQTSFELTNI